MAGFLDARDFKVVRAKVRLPAARVVTKKR